MCPKVLFSLSFSLLFLNTYLVLGERKQGRGRERGTEDPKRALCRQADGSEPDAGLELVNREIVT